MANHSKPATADAVTTPSWQVAALWALVGIPALWGFIETLIGALRLFTG